MQSDPTSSDFVDSTELIRHNEATRRFEYSRDGVDLAHLEYVLRKSGTGADVWAMTHTWTEPSARGQGLAAKVTVAALNAARTAGVQVIPVCPYVADYLNAHPEYADLLPDARSE